MNGTNRNRYMYEVHAGNIGMVYSGNNSEDAIEAFDCYVQLSKNGVGRAGNELVTFYKDGEIHSEYYPPECF